MHVLGRGQLPVEAVAEAVDAATAVATARSSVDLESWSVRSASERCAVGAAAPAATPETTSVVVRTRVLESAQRCFMGGGTFMWSGRRLPAYAANSVSMTKSALKG